MLSSGTGPSALPQAGRSYQAVSVPEVTVPNCASCKKGFPGPSKSKTSMWHVGRIVLGVQNGATGPPDYIPSSLMPPHPLGLAMPRPVWTRQNHLQTGVGHFSLSMHKWGMVTSVICECSIEDQTADSIIPGCQYAPQNCI